MSMRAMVEMAQCPFDVKLMFPKVAQMVATVDALGNTSTSVYDAAGRQTVSVDGQVRRLVEEVERLTDAEAEQLYDLS